MRRALVVVAAVVAVAVVLWLARTATRRHATPAAGGDGGTRAAAAATKAPARPAPPLRLPTATVVPDAGTAAGELGGRVLSTADGAPIARASLTFLHDGAAVTTESDGAGRFRLRAASPGAYELTSAAAKGFAPFEPQLGHSPVVLQARAGTRVDDVTLYLTPAIALTVAVSDDKGKPIAGAEVRVFDPARGPADVAATATDARGEAGVSARPWDLVEARKPGYAGARAQVGMREQSSGRVVLRLAAGAPRWQLAIRGRVVDGKGQGVDGALVEGEAQAELGERFRGDAQTLTTADGSFTLAGLDDVDYTLRASARGLAGTVTRGVHAGRRDVVLTLGAATAPLGGTVRDGSGKPVAAFSIVARMREGVMGNGPEERATIIDADGRYELALAPGSYEVAAAARGLSRSPWQRIALGDGGATLDFTLRAGSRVFGRVVERGSGKPLGGARVTVEGDPVGDEETTLTDAVTRDDGSFSLGGLAPGRQSLDVAADGHNGRILNGLQVPADGALGPLTIDLSAVKPGEEPQTELVGIAAMLGADPAGLLVKGVAPGGGAAEAGLAAGDLILAIDGQDTAALGFNEAVQLVRGPEGSVVTLTIKRGADVSVVPVRRKRINY